MGTRSAIGMVLPDGNIRSVYCHWDGYPSHTGRILLLEYKNLDKVEALISLGSISRLGPEIGHKVDFDSRSEVTRQQCVAYGRDRGEAGTEATIQKTKKAFRETYDWSEYFYLYENGEWKFSKDSGRFVKLKEKHIGKD